MIHFPSIRNPHAAAPVIHQLQAAGPLLLKCDRPATVTLKITGIPTPKVSWFLGKIALADTPGYGTQYDGATDHSLVIAKVTEALDQGLVVEAVNACGQDRFSLPVKTYNCMYIVFLLNIY